MKKHNLIFKGIICCGKDYSDGRLNKYIGQEVELYIGDDIISIIYNDEMIVSYNNNNNGIINMIHTDSGFTIIYKDKIIRLMNIDKVNKTVDTLYNIKKNNIVVNKHLTKLYDCYLNHLLLEDRILNNSIQEYNISDNINNIDYIDMIKNKLFRVDVIDKSIMGLYRYNSKTNSIQNVWNSNVNNIDVIGIIELEDKVEIYSTQGKLSLDYIIDTISVSIISNEHGYNMIYNLIDISIVDSNDMMCMTLEKDGEFVIHTYALGNIDMSNNTITMKNDYVNITFSIENK